MIRLELYGTDTIQNKRYQVGRFVDFGFPYPANTNPLVCEVCILALISILISVPVRAINFYRYVKVRQEEIYGVSTDFAFLNKLDTSILKHAANLVLNRRFASELAITRYGTKAALCGWLYSKVLAAIVAFGCVNRTAAKLRTMAAIKVLFFSECLATCKTRAVFRSGTLTSSRAMYKAVCRCFTDGKHLAATRANFIHLPIAIRTLCATTEFAPPKASGFQIELTAANRASDNLSFSSLRGCFGGIIGHSNLSHRLLVSRLLEATRDVSFPQLYTFSHGFNSAGVVG
jgi:hypothetical protein